MNFRYKVRSYAGSVNGSLWNCMSDDVFGNVLPILCILFSDESRRWYWHALDSLAHVSFVNYVLLVKSVIKNHLQTRTHNYFNCSDIWLTGHSLQAIPVTNLFRKTIHTCFGCTTPTSHSCSSCALEMRSFTWLCISCTFMIHVRKFELLQN